MLSVPVSYPLRVQNGGLFISRGIGTHPTRTLTSFELIYVVRGTLSLQEENNSFDLQAGESLILFPGKKHQGAGIFDPQLKFYWLHFDILQRQQNNPDLQLNIPQQSKVRDAERVLALFRLFLDEQQRGAQSPSLALFLLLLLQEIGQAPAGVPAADGPGTALAYKARQLIATRYHQALGTAELAALLHCNADYLGRVFRATFNLTLTDALHQQRVSVAETLLLTENGSLADIAARTGFNDAAYFRRVFRKLLGITPAAYKKRYCREHVNSG
ncbi:transcriptional regulator [Enterobacterales bacterium]|nr:transcriptional regulator [Enterobacterales bacterium]